MPKLKRPNGHIVDHIFFRCDNNMHKLYLALFISFMVDEDSYVSTKGVPHYFCVKLGKAAYCIFIMIKADDSCTLRPRECKKVNFLLTLKIYQVRPDLPALALALVKVFCSLHQKRTWESTAPQIHTVWSRGKGMWILYEADLIPGCSLSSCISGSFLIVASLL